MDKPTIFILGAGSVGSGLALALQDCGYVINGIWNRKETENSRWLRDQCGMQVYTDLSAATPSIHQSKLIFVCTADDAIHDVTSTICSTLELSSETIVAHLSGCLTSEVIVAPDNCHKGSFHPLAACPDPATTRTVLCNTFITIEGDSQARTYLQSIAANLGSQSGYINGDQKARYHAAAVLASNLMVSLLAIATDEARACGLDGMESALGKLAIGALEKTQEMGIRDGITGPLVRGDRTTLEKHLEALSPESAAIYRQLSLRGTRIAQDRGLEASSLEGIVKLLSSS